MCHLYLQLLLIFHVVHVPWPKEWIACCYHHRSPISCMLDGPISPLPGKLDGSFSIPWCFRGLRYAGYFHGFHPFRTLQSTVVQWDWPSVLAMSFLMHTILHSRGVHGCISVLSHPSFQAQKYTFFLVCAPLHWIRLSGLARSRHLFPLLPPNSIFRGYFCSDVPVEHRPFPPSKSTP